MLPTTAAPAGSDAFFTRVADPRQDDPAVQGVRVPLEERSDRLPVALLGPDKQLLLVPGRPGQDGPEV